MSSASFLSPPAPRLPCPRARLPPPSAAARASLGFDPRRAAPAKLHCTYVWHCDCCADLCAHEKLQTVAHGHGYAPAVGHHGGFRDRWEWRLRHVSCFRNDQDVPTSSDNDSCFKYVTQSESSSAAEAKEEEVGSSNGDQEQSFKDEGWFLQLQKASLICLLLLTCL
nr:unnamed protein product [Digitaria exilis]